MIDLALLVGRAMTAGGEVGDRLRRTLVPRMHLLPGMRNKITDSMTPPLPRSALVHKTYRPRQLAERCVLIPRKPAGIASIPCWAMPFPSSPPSP